MKPSIGRDAGDDNDNGSGVKKRTIALLLISVIGAISLFVCCTWLRSRVLPAAFMIHPASRQRLEVVPTEKQIPSFVDATTHVSLGYAQMDLGAIGKTEIHSVTHGGTWILLKNASVQLVFHTPSPRMDDSTTHPSLDLIAKSKNYQIAGRAKQRMKKSLIETRWEEERTTIQPFWRWFTMRKDDFVFYLVNIIGKNYHGLWGHNQVICFIAPQTRGVVQVGFTPDDKTNAEVLVASNDDEWNVKFHVNILPQSKLTMETVLMPILGSFRFTTTSLADTNEIAELIAVAGISHLEQERTHPPPR